MEAKILATFPFTVHINIHFDKASNTVIYEILNEHDEYKT